jgi:hypothetical protein
VRALLSFSNRIRNKVSARYTFVHATQFVSSCSPMLTLCLFEVLQSLLYMTRFLQDCSA